jgi:hypothetical protein
MREGRLDDAISGVMSDNGAPPPFGEEESSGAPPPPPPPGPPPPVKIHDTRLKIKTKNGGQSFLRLQAKEGGIDVIRSQGSRILKGPKGKQGAPGVDLQNIGQMAMQRALERQQRIMKAHQPRSKSSMFFFLPG